MLHPGQFAILKKPLSLPGYRTLSLSGGWVLSCHEKLDLFYLPKHEILLLGIAWQTLPGRPSPEQELEALSAQHDGPIADSELMALEESWCGRYVLICDKRVFTDTCALLPVFHCPIGLSSDLTLLAEEAGLSPVIYKPGKVLDWMPGPLTHYPEIRRVMPSQIYCFESGEIRSRQLMSRYCPEITGDEERIRVFSEIFTYSLHNMQERLPGRRFLVALTGGYDSRSLFALAKYADLDFEAYTLEYDGIFTDDVELPKELCRLSETPYKYIRRDHSRYDPALEEEYLRHTAGLILDEDRLSYSHGQYDELAAPYEEAVLLRSSVWENVIEYYQAFTPDGPDETFYDWFCVRPDSPEQRSLEEYFSWHRLHPQEAAGLVASNIFLWEQREGCWLSAIESGFDLMPKIITLQPANCRLMLRILMGFPLEERKTKFHQTRIIRYACPAIADVPFGKDRKPDETVFTILEHKLKRLGCRLETRGLRRTAGLYLHMLGKKLK